MTETITAPVHGDVREGFEGVRRAFEENFRSHGDKGASCAVYVDGDLVVDLWGGTADVATGREWREDTVALVYSATKGAVAVLCAVLAERGDLDLDATVASYWPEFAANGKDAVTVRMLLNHQAGLPVLADNITRAQIIQVQPVVERLAAQAPIWAPGSAHGYHALTYGWLIGEVVRRATGHSLGQQFAELIAQPLGLDFHIGLPDDVERRLAQLVDPEAFDPAVLDEITDPEAKAMVLEVLTAMGDPESLLARALSTNGALPIPSAAAWNDRSIHTTEMPAANGITNARSLARMYAACMGPVDGTRLLDDVALERAVAEQSAGPDRVLLTPSRFGNGFMLLSPVAQLLSDSSFGHTGAGGALGFGDRDSGAAFGYVQNQFGGGVAGDPRTLGLIAALRDALTA